jgi:hypothetical protein
MNSGPDKVCLLAELTTIAAAELARDLFYLLRGDIKEATPFRPLGGI